MNKPENFARSGQIVDIVNKKIFPGIVLVKDGKVSMIHNEDSPADRFIIPGFIDAHIHIESSMLIPSEFARLAVIHGTVATVSDPHEIANVMGVDGVRFMIENGKKVPFKFYFGAPSCVPATPFETAGASLGPEEIEELLQMDEVKYLSEMMNFPGVLNSDPQVKAKLAVAEKYHKPVDGHAPGLLADAAAAYIHAGISTDHECFTLEEALDKAFNGMYVQIREGSAAKNFDDLIPVMGKYPERVMFCSDDRHPNDLAKNHVNDHVRRAVAAGFDPITVLRACTLHPVRHYKLDVGLLREGDPADFIIVDNLKDFNVMETVIGGITVAKNGQSLIKSVKEVPINKFNTRPLKEDEIQVMSSGNMLAVIRALDGQLVTERILDLVREIGDKLDSSIDKDILKLVVYNRYNHAKPAVAFINHFGLKRGAIASSVAHDSHNIIAVGTNDGEICRAINLLVKSKGGVSLVNGTEEMLLPLPVAGLMSNRDAFEVAEQYDAIDKAAKALGSTLRAPYMTLSFMALLVIPDIKLSDKGLFDGKKFEFIPLMTS
ncbi:MAG TPA: adenine deaminase [Bacteroidales bacterium]|nr:adenine deaminase [Bacteroidales bacterium]